MIHDYMESAYLLTICIHMVHNHVFIRCIFQSKSLSKKIDFHICFSMDLPVQGRPVQSWPWRNKCIRQKNSTVWC